MNVAERLTEIAQRLDELSEDGPSELLTLSEELGKIADNMPAPMVHVDPVREEMPRWLREINSIVQNEMRQRRGYRSEEEYQYARMMKERRYWTATNAVVSSPSHTIGLVP